MKRPQSVWFHLYDMDKTKLQVQKTDEWYLGTGDEGGRLTAKGQEEIFQGDRSVFYLDYGGGYMTASKFKKYTSLKGEFYHI